LGAFIPERTADGFLTVRRQRAGISSCMAPAPRAWRLLPLPLVDGRSQDMIRAIRQALDMTQAEFGHALGWAPSTISKWESGRGEPNRLALKIILAFAEERKVRYRPRRELVMQAPDGVPHLPVVASPPRPVPAISVLPPTTPGGWVASAHAEHPRWEAALSFRVALDRGRPPANPARHPWLRKATVAGAALGALFLIGVPMSRSPERETAPVGGGVPVVVPVPDDQKIAETHAPAPRAAVVPEPPPPTTATLEGVSLLGGVRQAMFRTPTETITLTEGAQLGGRRATRIGAEGVELREPTGELRMIGIGGRVPID